MADMKSEITELQAWASSVVECSNNLLQILKENPTLERDPALQRAWLDMKQQTAQAFVEFILTART